MKKSILCSVAASCALAACGEDSPTGLQAVWDNLRLDWSYSSVPAARPERRGDA